MRSKITVAPALNPAAWNIGWLLGYHTQRAHRNIDPALRAVSLVKISTCRTLIRYSLGELVPLSHQHRQLRLVFAAGIAAGRHPGNFFHA